MANVTITKNINLSEVDLSQLKEKLSAFNDFIYKNTSTVVNSPKTYNKKMIKPMSSDGEAFTLKVDISKNTTSNLFIEYILRDSLGTDCISFDNEYTDVNSIKEDLDYVISHLEEIK